MGAEQILGGEGGAARLGIEVQAAVRADLTLGEDLPHDGGSLVQVGRELIHIPADELVALVGIEGAEHTGLAGGADLVLVGMTGQVGVVAFQVQLHEVDVVGLKEGDGCGCIEVILVHRRLLGLRLDQELSVQADLLSILVHMWKNLAMCACSRFICVFHSFRSLHVHPRTRSSRRPRRLPISRLFLSWPPA